jgi:peroxiredoxin
MPGQREENTMGWGSRVQDGSKILFMALMLTAVVMTGIACVVVVVALSSVAGGQSDQPSVSGDRSQGNAPDFTLTDLDGHPVSLSQFRGQPVVVNFWATWCPPCRAEVPHFSQAYEQEQGKVVFLAIAVDEPANAVRRFAEENEMPFTILLDGGGKVASEYRVNGIPVTFFINRDGEIMVRYVGQMSSHAIEEGLRRIR